MFRDVFEIEHDGTVTKAVLISQVCDMVVRILKKDTLPNRNESMATLILEIKTPSNGKDIFKHRIGNEVIYWDIRKKMLMPAELLSVLGNSVKNTSGFAALLTT